MRKSELIDVYILEILEKHANVNNRLYQKDIIRYLDLDYNIQISRNTLATYLSELRENGYIAGERGIYKINIFSDLELRLLIDGVLYGQHIPMADAKTLINKLKGLSELGLKNRINHVHYVEGIKRTQNDKLYVLIDKIDEAIQKNRRLRIEQCRYNSEKKLIPTGKEYIVDPYYLVPGNSRYYLICYVDAPASAYHGKELENLRVDRFWNAEIIEENRKDITTIPGCENGFFLDKYMKEHIYMFSGISDMVTLRINPYNIGDFIDWFGSDFRIIKECDEYIDVEIRATLNAIKYWALQYGEKVTVLKPKELKKEIQKTLNSMMENYLMS